MSDFDTEIALNRDSKKYVAFFTGSLNARKRAFWTLFPCDTDRTQTCNLLIRRHNSAVFADFRRFLCCFINVCISVANIAILFHCIFVKLDLIHMFVYKLCTENQNLYTK